jgi:ComF family protein
MRCAGTAVNQGRLLLVYKWINKARSIVFPAQCRLCLAAGTGGLELCSACKQELPWLTHACQRCALPLTGDLDLCAKCLAGPPALDACHALFSYDAPINRWIHALKFGQDLAVAHMLGQMLADHVTSGCADEALLLLPVPLHPNRLRQRGYNQALELARPLLRQGWPLSCGICRRRRHTAAQAGLPAHQRRGNLRSAFSADGRLDGQHILLIDDVMTTGATLNELARTMKMAGADRVEARVIARALKQH